MSEEREIEVVAGTIVGTITKKPDTWQVEVQPDGSQYTKKLWTKSSTIIAAANAKIGQHAAFVCGASYWDGPNGQVRSLWINEETDASAPVSDSPATRATPGTSGQAKPQNRSYAPDLKDRMIVRQTALKAAAEIMAANSSVHPDYDPALEVMRAAARFETWVYRDIDAVPSEAGRPALSEHDDAIPF